MHHVFAILITFLFSSAGSAQAAGVQSVSVFGGAVAGYNVKTENVPWSPMVGVGFEYGTKKIALYADIHSLPLFESRWSNSSVITPSYVMGTLGMTTGNHMLRVGPYLSAGYKGGSVGARFLLTPKGGPNVGWHGMEYRVGYYMTNVVYGAVLYTWRWTKFGLKARKK